MWIEISGEKIVNKNKKYFLQVNILWDFQSFSYNIFPSVLEANIQNLWIFAYFLSISAMRMYMSKEKKGSKWKCKLNFIQYTRIDRYTSSETLIDMKTVNVDDNQMWYVHQ